jgi:hypothetical protein
MNATEFLISRRSLTNDNWAERRCSTQTVFVTLLSTAVYWPTPQWADSVFNTSHEAALLNTFLNLTPQIM